ncbi:ABC transporter substrate-binding protein [Paenibacillus sp. GCM10023252]|uniref:ABC transporter substrate-binding protein n=1 Tax=Paenibacillus sp. GCM10023252 TaxID=3252649 RepID=UPI00360F03E4
MKKTWLVLLTMVMLVSMLAACGGNGNNGGNNGGKNEGTANSGTKNEGDKADSGKQVTVKMFQFKVEIAEALDRMIKEYEKAHPNVKIEVETVGGGADYGAALKAKFAAGDQPDIFNNGGFQEMNTWMEHLEDLSDQPWVADELDVAKEPMTKDGKIYGMPVNIEGYGFIYNKDLFAKAGITELPKTLSQLEAAAKKLQDAGITPFSNGYSEWWVLGNHNFNVAVAQQQDPTAFVNSMNDGSGKIAGNPVFGEWANLLDTTLKYSNKNPLTTDYNTQVTLFASGEAAMMQQGNWTQVQIDGINKDLNIGVLPMPINDDAEQNDKLYVGVPNNWVVNKNSKVKQEAKDFLNWMVSSEEGKRYIVEEFKFIPAFKSIEVKDQEVLGDIANDIIKYSQEGKILSWNWFKFPEGVVQELGSAMQAYVAKNTTKEQMMEAFDKSWANLRK